MSIYCLNACYHNVFGCALWWIETFGVEGIELLRTLWSVLPNGWARKSSVSLLLLYGSVGMVTIVLSLGGRTVGLKC